MPRARAYLYLCLCLFLCVGVGVRVAGATPTELHARGGVVGKMHKSEGKWKFNRTAGEDDGELVKRDGTKYVLMHHIVGNTYPYTQADWVSDIQQIAAKGVDAIALNIGSSSWQRTQVASAYAAALASGTSIKLFLSFDFTELSCSLDDIVARTAQFARHPAQFTVSGGKVFVSSYGGECLGNSGWQQLKDRTNAYVMPFIWGLEGRFASWPSMDSWYCWGCAWAQGNFAKTTSDDLYYANQLGSRFATTISGGIFTHLAYKNFYLRGDDWLPITRWEQIMTMRSMLTFVEMVTWNDWGESDYYGTFKGAQPEGTYYAEAFPHTAWFDMSAYFIKAFKTGVYPAITKSTIYFWARPHPAAASASQDSLGKPSGHDWTEDSMWAAVFAPSPATVILSCGSSTKTFTVSSGITKLKIPLAAGQMSVKMIRNGNTVIDYKPKDFSYTLNPLKYNYNAWAGSASATNENSSPSSASSTTSSSTTSSSSSSSSSSRAASSSGSTSSAATPSSGSTVNSWSLLGCYPDADDRLISGSFTTDNAQTISVCLARCAGAGYTYAGVEYGNECYCSNTIRAGISPVTQNECTKPCAASPAEICGGPYRINVYKRGSTASIASSAPVTTPKTTTTTTITTTTTTSATPAPTSWAFYGCVAEGTTGTRRALTGPSTTQAGMTYGICQTFCAGYNYAGIEYGTQCYCGNTLTNNAATGVVISNSSCSVACGGDSSAKCGGPWTMNVFTKITTPTWSSSGCYVDAPSRMLRGIATIGISGLTTEKCIAGCSTAGYTMAGTQNGNECFCGSQAYKVGGAGVPGTGCTAPCNGNSAQTCGGSYRLNIYLKPGTSV